jgi:hypothetical protein
MAAFCRQRAMFEGENDAFWAGEAAEWDKLISHHVRPQRQIRNWVSGPEQERILSTAVATQTDRAPWRISS